MRDPRRWWQSQGASEIAAARHGLPPGTGLGLGLAVALAVGIVGCGGSGDGRAASCGKVAPCGGGLVGSWKVVAGCDQAGVLTTGASLLIACPNLVIEVLARSTTGTLTFAADGTYSESTVTSQTLRAELPPSCLSLNGTPLTCSETGLALKLALDVAPVVGSVNCTTTTRQLTCTCTFALGPQSRYEAGTFSTLANRATTVSFDGASTTARPYCVQDGSTLHWMGGGLPVDLGTLGMVRIPLGDDVVAARQ